MGAGWRPSYESEEEHRKHEEVRRRLEAEILKELGPIGQTGAVTAVPGTQSPTMAKTNIWPELYDANGANIWNPASTDASSAPGHGPLGKMLLSMGVPESVVNQLKQGEADPAANAMKVQAPGAFSQAHKGPRNELLGQAAYYGIKEADGYGDSELQKQIEAKRAMAHPDGPTHPFAVIGSAIAASTAAGLANGNRIAMDWLSRMPGGEPLAQVADKIAQTNRLQQWASGVLENARSQVPKDAMPWHSAASMFGNFVGHVPIGIAAFKLAGTLMPRAAVGGTLTSVIARGAVQGAIADNLMMVNDDMAWLPTEADIAALNDGTMEGFSKVVFGNKLGNTVFGAALGVGFDAIFHKVANMGSTATPRGRPMPEPQSLLDSPVMSGPIAWLPQTAESWPANPDRHYYGGRARHSGNTLRLTSGTLRGEQLGPPIPLGPSPDYPGPVGPAIPLPRASTPQIDLDTESTLLRARTNALASVGEDATDLTEHAASLVAVGASPAAPMQLPTPMSAMPTPSPVRLSEAPTVPVAPAPVAAPTTPIDRVAVAKRILELHGEIDYQSHNDIEFLQHLEQGLKEHEASGDQAMAASIRDTMIATTSTNPGLANARVALAEIENLKGSLGVEMSYDDLAALVARNARGPAAEFVHQFPNVVRNEDGQPSRLFHGTAHTFNEIDLARVAQEGMLTGPGHYTTDNPVVAGGSIVEVPLADTPHTEYPRYGYTYESARAMSPMAQGGIQAEHRMWTTQRDVLVQAGEVNTPAYHEVARNIARLEAKLNTTSTPAMQVRSYYAIPRDVFYWDRPVTPEVAQRVVEAAAGRPGGENLPALVQPNMRGRDLQEALASTVGNMSTANAVLRDAGFDAIHNIGGIHTAGAGRPTHNVYNIINPRALVPEYAFETYQQQNADWLASQLNKQLTLMQTDGIENAALAVPEFNDSHVTMAALAKEPSAISIVRNITDPMGTARDLVETRIDETGMQPSNWRLVEREGRVDLIASLMHPITDSMAESYSRHGLFPGMRVVSMASGKPIAGIVQDVQVREDGSLWATWRKPDAKPIGTYPDGTLKYKAPWTRVEDAKGNRRILVDQTAQADYAAPELWDEFVGFATVKAQESGTEIFSQAGRSEMPRWFEEFAAAKGINDLPGRAALQGYFDHRIVDAYRMADPEIAAARERMHAALMESSELEVALPTQLADMAKARGFEVHVGEQGGTILLNDTHSSEAYSFEDEAAASRFLSTYARVEETPLVPEMGPVPAEIVDQVPERAVASLPDYHDRNEAALDAYTEASDELDRAMANEATINDDTRASFADEPDITSPHADAGSHGPNQGLPATKRVDFTMPGMTPAGYGPPGAAVPMPPAIPGFPGIPRVHPGDVRIAHLGWLSRNMKPWRTTMAKIEKFYFDQGLGVLRPWQDYHNIVVAQDLAHNEAYNVHGEIARALDYIGGYRRVNGRLQSGTEALRTGRAWGLFMDPNPATRAHSAVALDMTPGDAQWINHAESEVLRYLGPNGPQMLQQLRRYVTMARAAQSAGVANPYPPASAFPDIAWYVEKSTKGYMNFENPDLAEILHTFVDGHGFEKHVRPHWDRASAIWNQVGAYKLPDGTAPFAEVSEFFLDWMKTVRQGHISGPDRAVDMAHSLISRVFAVSKRDAADAINVFTGNAFRGAMGWRPWTPLRDSVQMLLAAPRVGLGNLGGVLSDVVHNPAARDAMLQRAESIGTLQRGIPPIEGSGLASDYVAGGPRALEGNAFTLATRRAGEIVMDIRRDMSPAWARTINGTRLDPMWLYTSQGSWSRIMVGEAAYRKFTTDWVGHQAATAGMMPNSRAYSNATLAWVNRIGAGMEHAPRRQMFEQLAVGDIEGARRTFMQESVDESQFRYGIREQAPGMRSTGMRMLMQFGSYTVNSTNFAVRSMKNAASEGQWRYIAAFGTMAGMLNMGFGWLEDKYGWSFRKWRLFGGTLRMGPSANVISSIYNAYDPMSRAIQGDQYRQDDPTRFQNAVDPVSISRTIGQTFNPMAGVGAVGDVIEGALESPRPGMALVRGLLTGDRRGGGPDWNQIFSDPSSYQSPGPRPELHPGVYDQPEQQPLDPNTPIAPWPFEHPLTDPGYPPTDGGLGGGRGSQ